ncbi:3-hydroxyacyl-ACP dehydratase FabZ [Parvularcula marina]|uniref:3-hydroxyacyl-[acyl-carrier-protein] dehydratase FabZ n=1 Tax=Parvularcula marina TaxID=2292771 RepID=A0A371RJU3_9PROT|nr:3-hydroxyacyl-ACP dehydratase FabZ [Parvularcula marina]RFB05713.1 3-hydroxyacyl-[acyl-carrier-protein] dehydratase FabZ [Parvularcula marina]
MTEENTEFLPDLDLAAIKEILPHRFPMLMVDKIVEISKDGATGVKGVTANEQFFEGHFPQMAVMPGVLIIESMAQTAAAYTAYIDNVDTDNNIVLFMGVEKAKFRKPVVPGDQLRIRATITARRPPVWKYEAKAYVDDKLVAEAAFSAMMTPPKD